MRGTPSARELAALGCTGPAASGAAIAHPALIPTRRVTHHAHRDRASAVSRRARAFGGVRPLHQVIALRGVSKTSRRRSATSGAFHFVSFRAQIETEKQARLKAKEKMRCV